MPINIKVDINLVDSELANEIKVLLQRIVHQGEHMAGELARLETEVAENGSAIESAITLIENIAALLKEAGTDPAKLKALADALDTNSNRLAAAVTANTPAAGEAVPPAGGANG